MITVIITTICISVAVTITLPSFIVIIHTIVNVTSITPGKNASLSIPAPVLLLSLLLVVREPSSAQ